MEFKLCKELIRVDGEGRVSPRVQMVLSLPIKDMECSLTNLVFLSQASCTVFMTICSPTLWRRHCGHCSHQTSSTRLLGELPVPSVPKVLAAQESFVEQLLNSRTESMDEYNSNATNSMFAKMKCTRTRVPHRQT